MFKKYVSNTPIGTGKNFILAVGEPEKYTVRAYLRPELSGTFSWAFYFENSVNSTFADGAVAYRNRSGGCWRILRACIADGGEIGGAEVTPEPLCGAVSVTFDGNPSRDVMPDERFWSDPVKLALPDNHYLLYEWELDGDGIPCTPDHRAAVFVDTGNGFETEDSPRAPLPALFGCDRPYRKTIAFIGDSITQGCGTRKNRYETWVHRIAAMLGGEYSVWNLGLGYARADDAATDGSWLYKAKQADVVVVTLGVNDCLHGIGKPSTAGQVIAALERVIILLKEAGCEAILSQLPPFDFSPEKFTEWRAVEMAIPALAQLHGCRVFDIMRPLDATGRYTSICPYGGHPDAEGCRIAAEAFRHTFHDGKNWTI